MTQWCSARKPPDVGVVGHGDHDPLRLRNTLFQVVRDDNENAGMEVESLGGKSDVRVASVW